MLSEIIVYRCGGVKAGFKIRENLLTLGILWSGDSVLFAWLFDGTQILKLMQFLIEQPGVT